MPEGLRTYNSIVEVCDTLLSHLPPLIDTTFDDEPPAPLPLSAVTTNEPSYFHLLPREIFSLVSQAHAASHFTIADSAKSVFDLFWASDGYTNQEWADGLYRLAAEKFHAFRPADLLKFAGGRSKHYNMCDSLMVVVEQFFRLIGFVYLTTLLKRDFAERIRYLEKWVEIANICVKRKDFYSAGAITSAMLTNPMSVWLSRRAPPSFLANETRRTLMTLFSPMDHFGAVRAAMDTAQEYLPHPTVFLRDRHEGADPPPVVTRFSQRRIRYYDAGKVRVGVR